jgi:hypothetical protein
MSNQHSTLRNTQVSKVPLLITIIYHLQEYTMFVKLGDISLSTNGAYCVCVCTSETYGVSCEHRCDTSVGKICEPLDGNCTYG